MATEDGETPVTPDPATPDHEELRTMIREELHSVLGELPGLGGVPDPEGVETEAPDETAGMTLRDIEAATERAVRKAMGDLAKKAPAKKAAPKVASEPEPAPVDPPTSVWDKIKDKAWS
jgi:hypothetical protein